MNVGISALTVLMASGLAMGQVSPATPGNVAQKLKQGPAASQPAAPPSQAVASKPATTPRAGAAARNPFAKKAAAAKPVAEKAKAPAEKAKPAPEMAKAQGPKGRRDPFVSPIVKAEVGAPAANCTTGKRCLVAGEMILRGVVKSQDGMIAVVENQSHRTYFLRENDPIFNGVVVKITGDSVILRESGTDTFGKPTSREVVKRVSGPAA